MEQSFALTAEHRVNQLAVLRRCVIPGSHPRVSGSSQDFCWFWNCFWTPGHRDWGLKTNAGFLPGLTFCLGFPWNTELTSYPHLGLENQRMPACSDETTESSRTPSLLLGHSRLHGQFCKLHTYAEIKVLTERESMDLPYIVRFNSHMGKITLFLLFTSLPNFFQ